MINFLIPLLILFTLGPLVSEHEGDSVVGSGNASFYHDKFQGQITSNGEFYDKNEFTAAHLTLPFNSIVSVLNKKNGKSVIVRINDRGPFLKSRVIDLSRSAAEKLEMIPFGIVPVTITALTLLDKVPLHDSIFIENEVWNCCAEKISLSKISVSLWMTENWKHAFYMASKISLDNQFEEVGIRVNGDRSARTYELIISGIETKEDADSLVRRLKKQGFKHAMIRNPE